MVTIDAMGKAKLVVTPRFRKGAQGYQDIRAPPDRFAEPLYEPIPGQGGKDFSSVLCKTRPLLPSGVGELACQVDENQEDGECEQA